jgi:hypothetical protein
VKMDSETVQLLAGTYTEPMKKQRGETNTTVRRRLRIR